MQNPTEKSQKIPNPRDWDFFLAKSKNENKCQTFLFDPFFFWYIYIWFIFWINNYFFYFQDFFEIFEYSRDSFRLALSDPRLFTENLMRFKSPGSGFSSWDWISHEKPPLNFRIKGPKKIRSWKTSIFRLRAYKNKLEQILRVIFTWLCGGWTGGVLIRVILQLIFLQKRPEVAQPP